MTRPPRFRAAARFLVHVGLACFAILTGFLAWGALGIHAPGWLILPARLVTVAALAGAVLLQLRSLRLASGMLAGIAALHLAWFLPIAPRADRDWAAPVARNVTGTIDGSVARLTDIRDFAWSTPDRAEEAWIDADYDLDGITGLDLITSVWDNPDIAHILVSFHFADGRDLAFSIEVRKEEGESFNMLGGVLREFELALVAAPERDIVALRTEYRGETVRRYPVDLTAAQARALFEAYVALGNRLEASPEFYNTLTANCTTTAWSIAHVLQEDLPIDSRLLLSARLPGYLDDLGVLKTAGDG